MLVPPTLDDVRSALARAVGVDRGHALFREAAASVGLDALTMEASVGRVLEVARAIQDRDGIVSLVGLACVIRCETFLALNSERAVV